jgi:hypothetical protein
MQPIAWVCDGTGHGNSLLILLNCQLYCDDITIYTERLRHQDERCATRSVQSEVKYGCDKDRQDTGGCFLLMLVKSYAADDLPVPAWNRRTLCFSTALGISSTLRN